MSLAFLASALIQFALGLVVAALVGPAEFGVYALALGAAVLVQNLAFEWVRLSATRFHHAGAGVALPGRLKRITMATGLALGLFGAGLVGAASAAEAWPGRAAYGLIMVPLIAIAAGRVDLEAALMRAEFDERGYALLLALRNGLAAVLLPATAVVFPSGTAVLVAYGATLALCALAAPIIARRDRSTGPAGAQGSQDSASLRGMLGYAAPIVLTNALYLALFLGLRAAIAWTAGIAAAGQASLALDFVLKLFTTLGTALDLALFQLAVRAAREASAPAGLARLRANAELILAVLAPMAVGLVLVIDHVEPFLVSPAFRGAFATFVVALVPGVMLYAVVQYVLHPYLQLRQRTLPLVGAALAALGVGAATLLAGESAGLTLPLRVALGLAAALGAAMLVLTGQIGAAGLPGIRFLGQLSLAVGVMAGAVMLAASLSAGLASLAATILAGVIAYAVVAATLDLGGLRSLVRQRLGKP